MLLSEGQNTSSSYKKTALTFAGTILLISQLAWEALAEKGYLPMKKHVLQFIEGNEKKIKHILWYGEKKPVTCKNVFGDENIDIDYEKNSMTITYPANTYGSKSWAGAICPLPENTENFSSFSLSYTIRVPINFPRGRWLKLNGICFDTCPRGKKGDNVGNSLRMHTLKSQFNGFTAYIYGNQNSEGNIGTHFMHSELMIEPGKKYNVRIFVDTKRGFVEVQVNDTIIYKDVRSDFQTLPKDMNKWNIMFSSFRGWWDTTWSESISSKLHFENFKVMYHELIDTKTGKIVK